MANNLTSNTTSKVARIFLKEFESSRVLSKTVNTSLITPEFTPQFGDTVSYKRPHQYRSVETSDGDLTAATKNSIVSGKADAVVQNYLTVPIEWTNREEALQMDQQAEILRPAAQQLAIDLETKFAGYMQKNSALHLGTIGTPIADWADVAATNSLLQSVGVPMSGNRYAVMNPFAIQALAATQSGLASGSNSMVDTAWEQAKISRNFGGIQALMSNCLPTVTLGATTDRDGTVSGTPDGTYVTARNTMTQTITITGLSASVANGIRAGDTIKVTQESRNILNIRSRNVAYDQSGPISWYYKVVTGGNTGGSGEVTITVTAAAINEANGQYNNISNAITSGDNVTVLGSASQIIQPNYFYHEDAFGIGFIDLPKLHTWDTVAQTDDGISIRITKYSDGDKNKQYLRADILPAFATLNPLFAGNFYGN
jgi:P22 coat protein - gene protein 5